MGNIEHRILLQIKETFFKRTDELGISKDCFRIIDRNNFKTYTDANPAFCIYFGNTPQPNFLDENLLNKLVDDANFLLPIVDEALLNFSKFIPEKIRDYNGLSIEGQKDNKIIETIVNNALEAFNFLKTKRRVFISYKRDDSSSVAIQLYEYLERHNFDVFLDTHSIRKSEIFQDELWQRMVDSDVIILLSTKNYLESEWTTEELSRANAASIGLVQVVWPDFRTVSSADLSEVIKLKSESFINHNFEIETARLKPDCLEEIVRFTESIRARTLASRQDNLISAFMKYAKKAKVKVVLSNHKFIELEKNGKKSIIVPAIGMPKALHCEESQTLIKSIYTDKFDEISILYDRIYIRDIWLRHLEWLNEHLPVKTKEIEKVSEWLSN